MFEHFTAEACAVVTAAQQEARALRHHYVGTEHLLLGIAQQRSTIAADALAAAGTDYEQLRAAVLRVVGEGTEPDDAAYLAMLGIDLDVVRSRIEELFGPGALEMAALRQERRRRRGWRRRRATCTHPGTGPRRVLTPRSKKVLELSLREALALKHDWIGPEHMLLGIIREGEGLAASLLAQAGVDLRQLRSDVVNRLREAA